MEKNDRPIEGSENLYIYIYDAHSFRFSDPIVFSYQKNIEITARLSSIRRQP